MKNTITEVIGSNNLQQGSLPLSSTPDFEDQQLNHLQNKSYIL